jgi:hypothetical protein
MLDGFDDFHTKPLNYKLENPGLSSRFFVSVLIIVLRRSS